MRADETTGPQSQGPQVLRRWCQAPLSLPTHCPGIASGRGFPGTDTPHPVSEGAVEAACGSHPLKQVTFSKSKVALRQRAEAETYPGKNVFRVHRP